MWKEKKAIEICSNSCWKWKKGRMEYGIWVWKREIFCIHLSYSSIGGLSQFNSFSDFKCHLNLFWIFIEYVIDNVLYILFKPSYHFKALNTFNFYHVGRLNRNTIWNSLSGHSRTWKWLQKFIRWNSSSSSVLQVVISVPGINY